MSPGPSMPEENWRGYAGQFNGRDVLIDPEMIPKISLDAGALQKAAVDIKKVGQRVHAAGGSVKRAWQEMGEHYQAPETPHLLSGSRLVVNKADDLQRRMATVGDTIWQFTGEMQGVIARLEAVRQEARAFVAWITKIGPPGWEDQPVPDWLGGDGGHMCAWQRNQQLSQKVAAVLREAKATEDRYAAPIQNAFGDEYDPPPGKPTPVRNRTMAEDRSYANSNRSDWHGINLNALYDLPWGGMHYVTDDFADSVRAGVMFPFNLAGVDMDEVGNLHWNLKTAGSAWTGVAKLAALASPAMWLLRPRQNWNTTKVVVPGLVGFDEKGPWSGGRLAGNAFLLALPTGKLGPAGLMARAGVSLAARGGTAARLAGAALKAPAWVSNGRWAGIDARLLSEYLGNRNIGRVMTHPLDEVALPERLAARAPTVESVIASPNVDGVPRLAADAHHGRFSTVKQVMAAYDRAIEAARSRYLHAVEERGAQFKQHVANAPHIARELTAEYSHDVDVLKGQLDREVSAAEAAMRRNLDDVRSDMGLPRTGDYLGEATGHPRQLPDTDQMHKDRFMAAGASERQAEHQVHLLKGLYGKRLDQLSKHELDLLHRYLGAGTGITQHTPMSKVLPASTVADMLKENWSGLRGSVAHASSVRDAFAPIDRHDALSLGYKVGDTRPFQIPLHGYGEVVFQPRPGDVDKFKVPLGGSTDEAMKRAAGFAGDHVVPEKQGGPFTGTGLTGGGVPEYKVAGEVALPDGAKLYYYMPTRDGRVLQVPLATFEHGRWHLNPDGRSTLLGEPGGHPAGLTVRQHAWYALPAGIRERLTDLARGELAFEMAHEAAPHQDGKDKVPEVSHG